MPSSPISRASATLVMSPRCPRFQSVIPTRTGSGLTVSLVCKDARACACVITGTAADATLACFTKSLRVINIGGLLGGLQNAFPTLAIRRALDEWGRLRRIGGAQVLVVPLDLLAGAVGHVAEVIRLGRPTRVLEV